METHVMTKEQARRMGTPELAGKTVSVVLYKTTEKPADLANRRMAKDVYFNGERIGGLLDLEA